MIASSRATSPTVRPIGPTVSRVWLIGHHAGVVVAALGAAIADRRAQPDDAAQRRRNAGRAAGVGAEPAGTMRAAIAAAVPPEEPPGMRVLS